MLPLGAFVMYGADQTQTLKVVLKVTLYNMVAQIGL